MCEMLSSGIFEEVGADQTASAPGNDRARTIELLKESVGSFNLALERFKA